MSSQQLRNYSSHQKRKIKAFLYQNTPLGIFTISDVEAEIESNLSAIEWVCISLAEKMTKITRIEVHILSGLDIDLIHENLERLVDQNILSIITYDKKHLQENIEKMVEEFGRDWQTPKLKHLLSQSLITQYKLTDEGMTAYKSKTKKVIDIKNLDIAISGEPFQTFNVELNPRPNTFKEINMTPEIVSQVISLLAMKRDITGIRPISVNSTSFATGRSITESQIWISIESESDVSSFDKSNKTIYLTSSTFDRWGNPNWDESLMDNVPIYDTIKEMVVDGISHTYEMDEEIISDSLQLSEDGITWILEADLEMTNFIQRRDVDVINNIKNEVILKLPETEWNLSIILQIEPYYESEDDDLAMLGIASGRFHASVDRKGFSLSNGYNLWKKMMKEWKKDTGFQEYEKMINNLKKYECVQENLPKVDSIVVDVDGILNYNRRDTQQWNFSRLRQVISILETSSIKNVIFALSNNFLRRIDQETQAESWMKSVNIEFTDDVSSNQDPSIEIARKLNAHYLGNRNIPKDKKYKDMRIYSRQIKFKLINNQVVITGLEPYYDWRKENVFEKMYSEYY